jgi:hypothetical protein
MWGWLADEDWASYDTCGVMIYCDNAIKDCMSLWRWPTTFTLWSGRGVPTPTGALLACVGVPDPKARPCELYRASQWLCHPLRYGRQGFWIVICSQPPTWQDQASASSAVIAGTPGPPNGPCTLCVTLIFSADQQGKALFSKPWLNHVYASGQLLSHCWCTVGQLVHVNFLTPASLGGIVGGRGRLR